MKRRTLSLAIVAVLLLCGAVWARMTPSFVGQGVSAGCSASTGACTNSTTGECGTSYLLCEDFDGSTACGTGQVETCRNTWTMDGAFPDFHGTGLEGTYAVNIVGASKAQIYKTITTANPIYVFAKIKVDTSATNNTANPLMLWNSSYAVVGSINVARADANHFYMSCSCGGSSSYGAYLDSSKTWNVWGTFVKGSGANDAKCHVYASETSTKGSVYVERTNGSASTDPVRAVIGAPGTPNNMPVLVDHARIGSVEMTGVPD